MAVPANKSLGQHWLNDLFSLESIIDSVHVSESDTVLEIGPGHGSLTRLLVKRAKKVISVELDRELASNLTKEINAINLEVIESDILKFDFNLLPKDFKVVANIPYYLTSKLFRVLSESSNPFSEAAILIQKEVAERIVAGPGSMSLLSVSVQYFSEARLGIVVPAYLFDPAPKVDSQVVILRRRKNNLFPDLNEKIFFKVVKAGFGQRRKTLSNSLSTGLNLSKDQIENLLQSININPKIRAQELSLKTWHDITEKLISSSLV
jgi:16S rRNA (adenine1518-N6/adenine1519-N6)-dimethyltransferase